MNDKEEHSIEIDGKQDECKLWVVVVGAPEDSNWNESLTT